MFYVGLVRTTEVRVDATEFFPISKVSFPVDLAKIDVVNKKVSTTLGTSLKKATPPVGVDDDPHATHQQ